MSIKGPEKAGEILLYQTDDGQTELDVRLEAETVWLNLNQMAVLFQRDKSVISRHLGNIFSTGELARESTVAKFATVQQEGARKVERRIDYYNLDAIISVGYRVNSIRGTQFRIWATHILKGHLIHGYTLNERRLRERGLAEAEQATPKAKKIWESIAGDIQIKILNNVWCVQCRKESSIGNLTGKIESGMLVLRGSCTKCGGDVARVIENQ
jgi:hypothetical protein